MQVKKEPPRHKGTKEHQVGADLRVCPQLIFNISFLYLEIKTNPEIHAMVPFLR